MECPCCGSKLEYEDRYGLLAAHQSGEVYGDIYRCATAAEQEGECDSESFSVCGAFYTDRNGELHEGYPC